MTLARIGTAPGIGALVAGFAAGTLDPIAVTDEHLALIADTHDALRAFITVDAVGARRQAAASRARWRAGSPCGPLDGVPVALKDNIDVAGLRCTAGAAAFAERVPEATAPCADRLTAAGAVMLGKLNMHEIALGATTDNPVYGRCHNPHRAGYTPGGSSGGSGAAVAAGLCAGALGSDTLGSVRIPAAYCGVYGFKPSAGAIDMRGVVPLCASLDIVGPLARSAADLRLLAEVLLEPPWRLSAPTLPDATIAGLRIGVPRQLAQIALEPEIEAAFRAALDRLAEAGAAIEPVELPSWSLGGLRRAALLLIEAEGYRYYAARLGPDLPGLSPDIAAMLRYPLAAGAARLAGATVLLAELRAEAMRAFGEFALLALPTAAQASFAHGTPAPADQADLTALASIAFLPALSIPIPAASLPAGLQLIGPPGGDRALLGLLPALAAIFEEHDIR